MNRREFLKRAVWSLAALFSGLSLLRAVEAFSTQAAPLRLTQTDVITFSGGEFRVGNPIVVYRGDGPAAYGVVAAVSGNSLTVEWS